MDKKLKKAEVWMGGTKVINVVPSKVVHSFDGKTVMIYASNSKTVIETAVENVLVMYEDTISN